jgi:hypothetical protein
MVDHLRAEADDRGARVLGGIRQRFGDHGVGGDFYPLRQPRLSAHAEFDRNRAAPPERLQRRPQAAPGQDRGMDAAGHLLQVLQRARQPVGNVR